MPSASLLNLDQFKEIFITNFFIKQETKDINLSQEIIDYFNSEISQNFQGKITSKNILFENEELFNDEEFWKSMNEDAKGSLFITGSADYTEEIRKAILEEKRSGQLEEPFPSGMRLAQRKFYKLQLDLFLIDGQSGQALYKRSFKEVKSYRNMNQTSYYAFFDLIQSVKEKFFRTLLGGKKLEERYLISK